VFNFVRVYFVIDSVRKLLDTPSLFIFVPLRLISFSISFIM